eukprot:Em0009g708a
MSTTEPQQSINCSGPLTVNAPINVANVYGLTLEAGVTNQKVLCSNGAGLRFQAVRDVQIVGLHWYQCSIRHPTFSSYGRAERSSGIVFIESANISLKRSAFTSSYGTGLSLYNVGGTVTIQNCSFTNNTVTGCIGPIRDDISRPVCNESSHGLHIEFGCYKNTCLHNSYARVILMNSFFTLNKNPYTEQPPRFLNFTESLNGVLGSGLAIVFGVNSVDNIIEIMSCSFQKNSALFGAGLAIIMGNNATSNQVRISQSSQFSFNSATQVGGGIILVLSSSDGLPNNSITVSASFISNSASMGGAMGCFSGYQLLPTQRNSLTITQSSFTTNIAHRGGSALSIPVLLELDYNRSSPDLSLGGNRAFQLNSASSNDFYVTGPLYNDSGNSTYTAELIAHSAQQPLTVARIVFNVSQCPFGCPYNATLKLHGNGLCPENGKCPFILGYCKLPEAENDICANNRGGAFCSYCTDGNSFTYAGIKCVDDSRCSYGYKTLLVFLIFLYWAILTGVILFALKFKFRVGSGRLYCVLYYFSIINYFVGNNYPTAFLQVSVDLISGIVLQPRFLGSIDLCLSKAPWLSKCDFLKMDKIKPILDEFQGCYKDEYRCFAGFYLIVRELIYLISLFPNLKVYGAIYTYQWVSIIAVIIHAMVQPYKEKWLNILDTVLLSNLVAVSLLFGGTAYTLFGQNDDSRNFHVFLVHIFVLMPIIYAVVLGIYLLIIQVYEYVKQNKSVNLNGLTESQLKSSELNVRKEDRQLKKEMSEVRLPLNQSSENQFSGKGSESLGLEIPEKSHTCIVIDYSNERRDSVIFD